MRFGDFVAIYLKPQLHFGGSQKDSTRRKQTGLAWLQKMFQVEHNS